MQFGIFTVGDLTTDPTTGRAPTEHERIVANGALADRIGRAGREPADLVSARPTVQPTDAFSDVPDFEKLLRG